jgi:hypothetical protein
MTKEQLGAVLVSHKAWLEGKEGQRANLTRASLTRANLTGASLTGAFLTGAFLTGANLTGANLTGASLTGAFLTGANLTGANLTRADLTGAFLTRADLTGADLTAANLTGADLTAANLTGAQIRGQTVVSLPRRATRSDGYEFFLWHCKGGFFVSAGCRFLTMKDARTHWTETRGGTPLGDETMDILRFFVAAIRRAVQ